MKSLSELLSESLNINESKSLTTPIIDLYTDGPYFETDETTDALGLYFAFSMINANGIMRPLELIYIGMSADESEDRGIGGRINDYINQDLETWRKLYKIPDKADIVYYCIPFPDEYKSLISSVEAACVNFYQPLHNSDYKDTIPSKHRIPNYIRINGSLPLKTKMIDPNQLNYSEES